MPHTRKKTNSVTCRYVVSSLLPLFPSAHSIKTLQLFLTPLFLKYTCVFSQTTSVASESPPLSPVACNIHLELLVEEKNRALLLNPDGTCRKCNIAAHLHLPLPTVKAEVKKKRNWSVSTLKEYKRVLIFFASMNPPWDLCSMSKRVDLFNNHFESCHQKGAILVLYNLSNALKSHMVKNKDYEGPDDCLSLIKYIDYICPGDDSSLYENQSFEKCKCAHVLECNTSSKVHFIIMHTINMCYRPSNLIRAGQLYVIIVTLKKSFRYVEVMSSMMLVREK
jgi:hypothetical protein